MPPAGRAWPGTSGRSARPRLMGAWHAVRSFLDEAVDILVREHVSARSAKAWTARFAAALGAGDQEITTRAAVEGRLPELVRQWAAPGLGEAEETPVRLGLRLGLPEDDDGIVWPLKLVAEASSDPSLRAEVGEVWRGGTERAAVLAAVIPGLHEALLLEIDRACRLWQPLAPCLDQASPRRDLVEPEQVVELLAEAAPLLLSAGFRLHVPPELSVSGRQRLRARLRGRSSSTGGEASGLFGLQQVLTVHWEAALGDEQLTSKSCVRSPGPNGRWCAGATSGWWWIPDELEGILALLERPPEVLEGAAALRAVISEEAVGPGGRVGKLSLESGDALLATIEELRAGARRPVDRIAGLEGALRPYQAIGVAWLAQLGRLGLGACLADDMGLGKTVQVIAHLLLRRATTVPDAPCLLVAPTSVFGNWKREFARFAPAIDVHLHHGPDRAQDREALLGRRTGRRRGDELWGAALGRDPSRVGRLGRGGARRGSVHQEPPGQGGAGGLRPARQPSDRPDRNAGGEPAHRSLVDLRLRQPRAPRRRDPVQEAARDPIERFRDPRAVEKMQRLTSPFILRRRKSDPGIAPELPPRIVLRSSCTLTREQASLYQASLESMMDGGGVERRHGSPRQSAGVDHRAQADLQPPALFLRERGGDSGRSGKLRRLAEELEIVFAEGEAVLLFTQYRAMGEILVRFLEQRFAISAPFLHGGVTRAKREAMVARFQEGDGPPAMVVSIKAGGTGINLTRASHVVHVDRWWNPAVEAQATDRAHRIGQKRTVVVHTLVTAGTLEEKIDRMLEEKADLAEVALSGGEQWLTELDDDSLRELLALDPEAADRTSTKRRRAHHEPVVVV